MKKTIISLGVLMAVSCQASARSQYKVTVDSTGSTLATVERGDDGKMHVTNKMDDEVLFFIDEVYKTGKGHVTVTRTN